MTVAIKKESFLLFLNVRGDTRYTHEEDVKEIPEYFKILNYNLLTNKNMLKNIKISDSTYNQLEKFGIIASPHIVFIKCAPS